MLVGSASRGGAGGGGRGAGRRKGGKERNERRKAGGEHMFAAGLEQNRSERTDRHEHARSATPRLVGKPPKPRWYLNRPLVGGAPPPGGRGQHRAVTHPLTWHQRSSSPPSLVTVPAVSVHVVKAESHRSTEEVEGGVA